MVPYARRKSILELMHSKDIVCLDEIKEHLDVSVATVRRDLKALSEEGQIELLSGGAAKIVIKNSNEVFFLGDSTKLGKNSRYTYAQLEDEYKLITSNKATQQFKDDSKVIIID